MNRLAQITILLSVLNGASALAGSSVCSSPDQKVSYLWSVPDLGIRPPTPPRARVVLTVDGELLIQKNVRDQEGELLPNVEKATYEELKTIRVNDQDLEPRSQTASVGHELRKVRITEGTTTRYAGVIHCRTVVNFVP